MIRKFIAALMLVALAGLFYITDRFEQDQLPQTASHVTRVSTHAGTSSANSRTLSSVKN